jgi:FkbM family methyltransferase
MAVYNFVYDKPVVVVDIGMNTGFASLYFASRDNTIATYSYEPFKATYEQAINNFSRNPSLQTKIKSFNYGVGGKEETLKVEYEYSVKGSIGIEGISSQYKDSVSQNIIQETLQIKPFNEVFQEILSEHPDTDIVAKIDCEGSEYEIIKSLAEHNQLNKIKIIMMEWHRHGPNPLIEELNKVGFISFSRLPYSKNVGNIYAIRC